MVMAPSTAYKPVSLAEYAGSEFSSTMLYGVTGIGKSIAACCMPVRTFVFDCDIGLKSIKAWYIAHRWPMANVTVAKCTSLAEFVAAMDWLEINQAQYQLTVVDTSTQLERIFINEVCKNARVFVPTQPQWGVIRQMCEDVILRMRKLRTHLIWTGHEMLKTDPSIGTEVYRPAYDGRFQYEYAQSFDLIARMRALNQQTGVAQDGSPVYQTHRVLSVGGIHTDCHTKDRYNTFQRFEMADMFTILGKACWSVGVQLTPSFNPRPQVQAAPVQPQIAGGR